MKVSYKWFYCFSIFLSFIHTNTLVKAEMPQYPTGSVAKTIDFLSNALKRDSELEVLVEKKNSKIPFVLNETGFLHIDQYNVKLPMSALPKDLKVTDIVNRLVDEPKSIFDDFTRIIFNFDVSKPKNYTLKRKRGDVIELGTILGPNVDVVLQKRDDYSVQLVTTINHVVTGTRMFNIHQDGEHLVFRNIGVCKALNPWKRFVGMGIFSENIFTKLFIKSAFTFLHENLIAETMEPLLGKMIWLRHQQNIANFFHSLGVEDEKIQLSHWKAVSHDASHNGENINFNHSYFLNQFDFATAIQSGKLVDDLEKNNSIRQLVAENH